MTESFSWTSWFIGELVKFLLTWIDSDTARGFWESQVFPSFKSLRTWLGLGGRVSGKEGKRGSESHPILALTPLAQGFPGARGQPWAPVFPCVALSVGSIQIDPLGRYLADALTYVHVIHMEAHTQKTRANCMPVRGGTL